MAALVLDVGSWFRSSRAAQASADAAALAGAQALPGNPAQASGLAVQYGTKNGGGVTAGDVTISSQLGPNDTITVEDRRTAPSFFAKLFGIGSVDTPKSATARAYVPSEALGVAPVTVNRNHPMLACTPPPCSGSTQIDLDKLHTAGSSSAAGAFGLLNLNPGHQTGNVGAGILANWLTNGSNQLMPLGTYDSVPSSTFNNTQFDSALVGQYGHDLLFPVYNPPIILSGSNAQYNIIGWVGFHVTSADFHGSGGTIYGNFTSYTAQGIQATSGGQPDFGTEVIQLVK
jgi:hypothetical protein